MTVTLRVANITTLLFISGNPVYILPSKKINKIYREKSIPMTALWCTAYYTHVVIILIIYSVYISKNFRNIYEVE